MVIRKSKSLITLIFTYNFVFLLVHPLRHLVISLICPYFLLVTKKYLSYLIIDFFTDLANTLIIFFHVSLVFSFSFSDIVTVN